MALSHKTHRDLHLAFAATSVGAILEMSGGADRTHFFVKVAVLLFTASIPVNFYAWLVLNDELFYNEDEARFFMISPVGAHLLLAGGALTACGIWNLVYYFSPLAAELSVPMICFFGWYELNIRLPGYTAWTIWTENDTREARLEDWRSRTGKGPKDFDWFIKRFQNFKRV
jgi:hypothetical protein